MSRTRPCLSGSVGGASCLGCPAVAVEREQVAAGADRLALQRERDARDEREHQHDDGHGRAEPERRDPHRPVQDAAGERERDPTGPGQPVVALAVVQPPERRGHRLPRPGRLPVRGGGGGCVKLRRRRLG